MDAVPASRRPGGAVHRGMVWLLRHQARWLQAKELRLLEYDSAYPPVLGPQIRMVVLTLHEGVARWMQRVFARKQLSMQTCVLLPRKIPRGGPIDAKVVPRRALLEAMLHVRGEDDLSLLTNALRALRYFEGNELLIYREMLRSQMEESLIMQAHRELEPPDEYERWVDYVPTKRERASFLYVHGQRDGRQEGRALAVLDLLRIRGIEVDAESETKVLACHDSEQLVNWLARATTVVRVDELFEPG